MPVVPPISHHLFAILGHAPNNQRECVSESNSHRTTAYTSGRTTAHSTATTKAKMAVNAHSQTVVNEFLRTEPGRSDDVLMHQFRSILCQCGVWLAGVFPSRFQQATKALGRSDIELMKRTTAKSTQEKATSPTIAVAENFVTSGAGQGTGSSKPTTSPSQADIETVAYLKYLDEGCHDGNHLRHWLEAERQLRE